jgi:membrane protein DedA with SNARE-associated domain
MESGLGELLQTYGYWVLALGCLLEGETILALAGVAAQAGHLQLPAVIGVAAVCGFLGDQAFFWLGRRHGTGVLRRFPDLAAQAARVERLTQRWHAWVIVMVRFAYGLRIAGPVLIGTTSVSAVRFALFNAIGAVLWAHLVALVGWFAGAAVDRWLGKMHRIEDLAIVIVLAVLLAWGVRRLLARRGARSRDRE